MFTYLAISVDHTIQQKLDIITREERGENKRRAKLLILCGLESLNTHNATSSAGILYGLESLNTYNGH